MFPRIAFLPVSSFKEAKRKDAIGRFLQRHSLIEKVLREVASRCRGLYDCAQMVRENDTFMPLANRETKEAVGYGNLDHEVLAFLAYRNDIVSKRMYRTESGVLFKQQEEDLTDLLDEGQVKTVLNFGVCYGHIDALLARKFPSVQFIGIDRSKFTKALNEAEFDLPNIKFMAGDVHEALASLRPDVLLHSRTAVCLNRPAVKKLYRSAYAAGVKYVVGYEQYGTSWQTFEPYVFDLTDQPSVLYRHFMFIHNYPGLLKAAGYEMEKFEILRTASDKQDLRLLSFVARRT